ncbi:MAG: CpsB/CapC family capsule biosynthesis tyrosine phosphatase [Gemmatimonadaceae bacterium]
MIDLHSHLLPGVDDGSRSLDTSVRVLERFGGEGVDIVVCTPHLAASAAATVDDAAYQSALDELVRAAPPRPALLRGWEIMLDAPGVDLSALHLRLGASTAILIEFPRMNVPAGATREIARLRASGVVPVLAHPERYWGCSLEKVREWRAAGAVIQLSASMLAAGGPHGELARAMLEGGLADCIASDNHGDARSVATARQWLEETGAPEQARLLTHTNAERLLQGERTLPVAPTRPVDGGMVARLKALLMGRRARRS